MPGDASAPEQPFTRVIKVNVAAVTIAADLETDAGVVPFDGVVSAVSYIPSTVLTGTDTNSRTVVVVNKGAAGSGTTIVATKAFVNGVNAPADVATPITLSATAANLVVVAGDILVVQSNHVASGLVDPGGLVEITVTRS